MENNLIEIPKVELHLHLDGSIRVETAQELTNRDVKDELSVDETTKNLNDYISKFALPISLMQNKENISRISYELAEDLLKDNVIYAEIRFAPMQHLQEGLTPEEVVEAVIDGLSKSNLKTNIILCMMRNANQEENKKVIDLAKEYLGKGVCAIDLAGAEALYKTEDFKKLFAYAKSLDIPFTIHAGEADGPSSIKSALSFGTKRIGHGIRALEEPELINTLISNNITLEVCPTSNLDTCIIDSYEKHPIKKLIDLGINVTINTDNRTVSNVTLTEEYEKLAKYHNFTKEIFYKCNVNAISASFLNEEEKNNLLNELKNKYEQIR